MKPEDGLLAKHQPMTAEQRQIAALTARCDRLEHALLTERGKLEKSDAENDRLKAQLRDSCDEARSDPEMHVNGCPITAELTARVAELEGVLRSLKPASHYECEDPWYSCPKANKPRHAYTGEPYCDCGADDTNAKIDACLAGADSDCQEKP